MRARGLKMAAWLIKLSVHESTNHVFVLNFINKKGNPYLINEQVTLKSNLIHINYKQQKFCEPVAEPAL